MQVELNQIIRAASLLGLDVEQTYSKVDDNFFVVVNIKHDGNTIKSFSAPAVQDEAKQQLEQNKQALQTQMDLIDADIAKIEAIK